MRKIYKIIIALMMVCAIGTTNVNATTISDLEGEKQELEEKKNSAQEILEQLKAEKGDILLAIAELDKKVAEYTTQINELEIQKADLEVQIAASEVELAAAVEKENSQYADMCTRIQYAYENGGIGYMETLFTSSSVIEMVNHSEYVEQISNYDSAKLGELIETKQTIANINQKMQSDLAAIVEIEEEVAENKEVIEIMIEGKQVQVENYTESEEFYEDTVAQYNAEMNAISSQIASIEKAAREAAAAAVAEGKEVPVYYTGGSFQYPVSSGGRPSSPFGPRWGGQHNGYDIACPVGTPILAGESGTVVISQYSSSAGNYVLIDHGDGVYTVYMHNSSLAVSVGQQVTRGQVIAYSGNTGWSTGPHCHFGVRINGTYVDPAPYL